MNTAPRLHRGFDHFALRAADFDATVRFYREALGFTVAHEWTSPDAVRRSAFLDSGNGSYLELFDATTAVPGGPAHPDHAAPAPSDEARAAHNALLHIALRTDDVDAAYAHALAHGAREMQAPADLSQTGLNGHPDGTIRIAFVYGLDGEVIEFIRRADFPGTVQ
ncbi:VOC family protein [Streptomyces sp. NPDC056149]|uniref:VOC family protein n=1 Tax=Streptomyces sp. NPDC056149 TaxID=3345728 RepID=UPI0035DF4827